jgi:hypothetical protein
MFKSLVKKYFAGLTKNSILLAFASLFSDISTEMLYPILPVYLTQYLKANGSVVWHYRRDRAGHPKYNPGIFGWLSDKLQQRKPIALVGYFLSAVQNIYWFGKYMANGAWPPGFQTGRSGSRSAPRDALLAESVEPQHRGKAFGLEGNR